MFVISQGALAGLKEYAPYASDNIHPAEARLKTIRLHYRQGEAL